jgi:hypothetical protein
MGGFESRTNPRPPRGSAFTEVFFDDPDSGRPLAANFLREGANFQGSESIRCPIRCPAGVPLIASDLSD